MIQKLFGAALSIQVMADAAQTSEISDPLTAVASSIDDVIRQLRASIYELGLTGDEVGVRARTISLLREPRVLTGFDVHGSFDGPVDTVICEEIAEHLLATIREAVTNVGRHAHASTATVRLSADGNECVLEVSDNGRGLGRANDREGGLGLINMRRRAEKLHGRFEVESDGGGTVLTWRVPL